MARVGPSGTVDHARHIILTVGAVIFNGSGELLLVKHVPERGGFWQARWICPGGKLALGESIADGIRREVFEETGLSVELLDPLPPFERIHHIEGRLAFHVIYIDYTARLSSKDELRCGSDVGEARWLDDEDLAGAWDEVHHDTKTLLELAKVAPATR